MKGPDLAGRDVAGQNGTGAEGRVDHGPGRQAAADDVFAIWVNRKFVGDLEFALQHQKFTLKGEIAKGARSVTESFVKKVALRVGDAGSGFEGGVFADLRLLLASHATLLADNARLREGLADLAMPRGLIWRKDMTDKERAEKWAEHTVKMNATARAALSPPSSGE